MKSPVSTSEGVYCLIALPSHREGHCLAFLHVIVAQKIYTYLELFNAFAVGVVVWIFFDGVALVVWQ